MKSKTLSYLHNLITCEYEEEETGEKELESPRARARELKSASDGGGESGGMGCTLLLRQDAQEHTVAERVCCCVKTCKRRFMKISLFGRFCWVPRGLSGSAPSQEGVNGLWRFRTRWA